MIDLVVLGKVGLIDELTGDEHVVVLDVVDARLEVQDLLQRHLGALEAPALENLAELADTLFVGASRATDVEVVADHHDVAAVERAGGNDVLDMLVVKEATDDRLDFVLLAITTVGAGVGNDGAAASDNGRIDL